MTAFIPYIDLLFIPLTIMLLPRVRWLVALGFLMGCMIMMRMQIELMTMIGYPYGILGFAPDLHVMVRGMIVYCTAYMGYIIYLRLSRQDSGALLMIGAFSIFFALLVVSMLSMVA